ncbi:MAG: hypothetical protein ACK4LA_06475, partial [Aquificaceae bacterium]
SKHMHYAFLVSVTLIFLACLPLYPYFKVPIHPNLFYSILIFIALLGIVCIPLAYLLKKKVFPVDSSKDVYWSYTATRRYFWLYVLSSLPFGFSFLFFVVFAPLLPLLLGYLLSLCGLILVKPKEEDVI